MSSVRIPANLSYLTIYNPTLRPSVPTPDDEDAQEQAQILFYTSKERAVSRDRMLRQVGLAKALVNFSEMFNSDDACENVHSQTRRMVMVFPEPDFCIHAGVELAKTPRASVSTSKGKEKGVKGILKGKEKEPQTTAYDYGDASVIDQALRADIMRGYEEFKLTHGSFTSILSRLGQQVLELQLERFFTVWAWSWNIEDSFEFGQHLGTPLHPKYRSILPLLDALSDDIPNAIIPIAVTSTNAIPSTRFLEARFPAVLSQHLLKLVPSPPENIPPSPSIPQDGMVRPKRPPDLNNEKPLSDDGPRSTFMGMNMDIGKWNWLNFGKKPVDATNKAQINAEEIKTSTEETAAPTSQEDVSLDIDQSALDDAMASEGVTSNVPPSEVKPELEKEYFTTAELDNASIVSGVDITSENAPSSSSNSPSPPLPREFMAITVHLAEEANPLSTKRRKIYYLSKHPFLVALIGADESGDHLDPVVSKLEAVSRKVDDSLNAIGSVLDEEVSKSSTDMIPSLTKILQPKDRHVFALEQTPFAVHGDSERFVSNSMHLFNARALIRSQHGVQEVLSRGQSPQHWYMGRSVSQREPEHSGEMFMQVFRKETSLTDVDNVLTGVIRRMEEDLD